MIKPFFTKEYFIASNVYGDGVEMQAQWSADRANEAIVPLLEWMEEAREIIQDTAAGNKLSETSGTLLSRYQHLRERASECLAKWPGGEK